MNLGNPSGQAHDRRAIEEPPPLSAERAFVVQFRSKSGPGRFAGRVEHMPSARAAHFGSMEELLASGYAVAGGRGGPVAPVILSATADFKENLMVISGHHFGSAPPTVTLAHRVLKVKSFSKNRVVVDLPAGIEPATYRLTVRTNGLHRLTSGPFSAAIFALAER